MAKEKERTKAEKRKVARRTLHYFWQMYKKYPGFAIGQLVTQPISRFLGAFYVPLIVARIIDRVSQGISPDDNVWMIFQGDIVSLVLALIFGSLIAQRLFLWFIWKFEVKALDTLRNLVFMTLAEQSMTFHNNRMAGALVTQANQFVSSFEGFNDVLFFDLLYFIETIIFTVVILLPKAPMFVGFLVVFVAIYIVVAFLANRKIQPHRTAYSKARSKASGYLSDAVSNILTVKSYGREKKEEDSYGVLSKNMLKLDLKVMRMSNLRDTIFSFIGASLTFCVVIFLIVSAPTFGTSIGTMVLIATYSIQVIGTLWDINHIIRRYQSVMGDAYEMTETLDETVSVTDIPDAKDLELSHGEVDFDHISFRHSDAKEDIFSDFSLKIKPGERVGLVGVSGSGKTTLTKLLLRFADVQSGAILVDGQNINRVKQDSLRLSIAYVPQEATLFHRSVAENISYGKLDATPKEIQRAAELANAHEFIKDLPEKYETLVGERGVKLSGGQRQRVAIARAILKDAPILVLDEATSALDSESEHLIQDALKNLMKDRTAIVIAHRLSTVAHLDRIVVLENGKIVEQGTHAELVAKHGAYAKLWNRQSGGFIDED
jgi:ATP-binding cassette subfamily B protein